MIEKYNLHELHIYPVKSLGGISLSESHAEERGFRYDRRWMLVDERGRFLSQREYPRLALLKVSEEGEGFICYPAPAPEKKIWLPKIPEGTGSIPVTLWKDGFRARCMGKEFDEWFSEYLGSSCRLVYMDERVIRRVDPRYAVKNESVSFSDGYPYLVVSHESVVLLNTLLQKPVSLNRFRPNLVLSGGLPFAEDEIGDFRIGEALFRNVKPCARCTVITIDPDSATKDNEPLNVLSRFRGKNNKVFFGYNVVCIKPGLVKLSDPVEVISKRII
jgi:hypothetical protein